MTKNKHIFFVTGTDTEVGKTLSTCGFLEAANQHKLSSLGIKPIASGCFYTEKGLRNQDALDLMTYMSTKPNYNQVNPITIEPSIAPHIGASRLKINIDIKQLALHCRDTITAYQPDITFIEGSGGWRAPIDNKYMISDLVKLLNIPVILIINMKLGCINHTILTVESILSDNLTLAGWIANTTETRMSAYKENLATLIKKIPAPLLGDIPKLVNFDKKTLASYIHLDKLISISEIFRN